MKYIESGCKEEFRGEKQGIRIYENGKIYHIKQHTQSSKEILRFIKSNNNITELFDLITPNILRTNYINPNNISNYILYQEENIKLQEAKVYYWLFPSGNMPPIFLRNIYNKINEIYNINCNNQNNFLSTKSTCIIL
ncbi:MAG: hypothetical protein Terrestrivirus3_56 [Terrestrivirus sp.]|uniref:Uncharacterized protein n=1 Tax=Terrestrivirus sp. TaxID=2487775 RepID=A0A3G4ZLR9_9VIRU|nr:MAG: hypothetical protein Terrestrivirus3_56 [Terrestrivirus sp.]